MKTCRVLARAAAVLAALVLSSSPAVSQTTITLEGILKSTSGEAVPNAQVSVTDTSTNTIRNDRSNAL